LLLDPAAVGSLARTPQIADHGKVSVFTFIG
jgi:hypothetical protein